MPDIIIENGDCQAVCPTLDQQFSLIYCDPPREPTWNRGFVQSAYNPKYLLAIVPKMAYDSVLVICTNQRNRRQHEIFIDQVYPHLSFFQEIIWYYDFGTYTRERFVPSHDNILIYTKGHPPFNWEDIAIESQRLEAGDKRADIRGRVPGTVWNVPRIPGNAKTRRLISKNGLPDSIGKGRSQQPELIVARLVKAFTRPGQWVLDPFAGTGTTAVVCRTYNRHCVCVEIEKAFCEQIKGRLTLEQSLFETGIL